MTLSWTTRLLLLVASLVLASATALAQRGGGPGGGGPGGPGGPGGGMVPPHNGFMGDRGAMPIAPPPMRSGPQLGLSGRWWDDGKTVKHLNLRNDQQKKMDDIFNANRTSLLTLYDNLQREESRLTSMSPKELQDEAKVFAQIDRVAAASAELEKERAHVQIQIRQQMDPDQLNKLDSAIASLR